MKLTYKVGVQLKFLKKKIVFIYLIKLLHPQNRFVLFSYLFSLLLYPGNGSALCLSFWTSLYGAGVGALRVYMYDNTTNSTGNPIWELYTGTLTPDQWYKGEVPLSLPRPFRVSKTLLFLRRVDSF